MAQLLIADDITISRDTLSRVLREAGHRVTAVSSGTEAIERVRAEPPEMAIFDLNMPRMTGLQAAQGVKAAFPGQLVPVMIVSGRTLGPSELAEILQSADDFLRKPYNPTEICARVEVWLRTLRLFEEGRVSAQAGEAVGPAGLLAPLALMARVREEWRRSVRWNEPFALLLVDVAHGTSGLRDAEVMGQMARVTGRALRQVDLLGQMGPTRMGVILPNTHPAGAVCAAERLRRELQLASGVFMPPLCLGLALVPGREVTGPDELHRAAETALGRAQAEGPWSLCLHQHQGYILRS